MDNDQGGLRFSRTIIKPVLSLLSPTARKQSVWIVALVILNALLDFLSVAAFLPLLLFVVKPESISGVSLINSLYSQIGFSSPGQFIIAFAIALLMVIILKNIVTWWIAMRKASYAFGISEDLASRGMVRYLEMSYLNFSDGDFSRELNRIVNYPFAFANNVILPLTALVSELFVSALILTGIALYDWRIVSVLILLIIPIVILYQLRRKKLKSISKTLKEKYPLLMKYTLQVIEGFSEIKSTQTENYFHRRFQTVSREMSKVFAKDQMMQSGTTRLTEVIVTLLICALIVYSVSFQQNYQETLMLLGVYAGAGFRMIPSINRILHSTQHIRLHEHLLDELKPLTEQRRNEFPIQVERLRFSDTIDLRNVSFGYSEETTTLDNISLSIQKGEKVALTGVSGGGKTTLLLILLRFLKETTGELLVDGNRINDGRAWRRLLGYVPQNPYVLDGSIAENIAFGIPQELIDRKKIHQLLSDLGLSEMVSQQPNGMDTQIGERGIKLSGGQRQRLAIARVLYADVEILLLDEITNQVHTFMEKEILNILNDLSLKKTTIIMVTHHITDSRFFDSIYTLENGTLKEMAIQNV
jgi:ABC-type multidrug transport system fused ATPase/permease subunit